MRRSNTGRSILSIRSICRCLFRALLDVAFVDHVMSAHSLNRAIASSSRAISFSLRDQQLLLAMQGDLLRDSERLSSLPGHIVIFPLSSSAMWSTVSSSR